MVHEGPETPQRPWNWELDCDQPSGVVTGDDYASETHWIVPREWLWASFEQPIYVCMICKWCNICVFININLRAEGRSATSRSSLSSLRLRDAAEADYLALLPTLFLNSLNRQHHKYHISATFSIGISCQQNWILKGGDWKSDSVDICNQDRAFPWLSPYFITFVFC